MIPFHFSVNDDEPLVASSLYTLPVSMLIFKRPHVSASPLSNKLTYERAATRDDPRMSSDFYEGDGEEKDEEKKRRKEIHWKGFNQSIASFNDVSTLSEFGGKRATRKSDLEVPLTLTGGRETLSPLSNENDESIGNDDRENNGRNDNLILKQETNASSDVTPFVKDAKSGTENDEKNNDNKNSNSNRSNNNNKIADNIGSDKTMIGNKNDGNNNIAAISTGGESPNENLNNNNDKSNDNNDNYDDLDEPVVTNIRVSKSNAEEPFGIIIQGGIDAPYIAVDGIERRKMRIKEVRPGGAAARQLDLRSGMEVLRVNNVDVRDKTHGEIVSLIQGAGRSLDLDVVSNGHETEAGIFEPREQMDSEEDDESEYDVDDAAAAAADDDDFNVNDAADFEAAYANHVAINAAIISGSLEASKREAAASAAHLSAAQLEMDRQLAQLEEQVEEALRDEDEEDEEERSEYSAALTGEPEVVEPVVATSETRRSDSPMSNIFWGAVVTHVLDSYTTPANEKSPANKKTPTNVKAPVTDSKGRKNRVESTPSPFHIPTPSPNNADADEDEDARAHANRVGTPYPVCFPRAPSVLEGGAADGRMTPGFPPPEVDVAQTLKEVVEATPFERPMTAWSIHDPTEDGKREEEREEEEEEEETMVKMVYKKEEDEVLAEAGTIDPTMDESANNSAFASEDPLDPLSEAAACKWRPVGVHTTGVSPSGVPSSSVHSTRFHSSTPRQPTQSASRHKRVTASVNGSVGVASGTRSGNGSPTPSTSSGAADNDGGEEHMYLFVGTLTLLAASAMVGHFVHKHYYSK